MKENVYISVVMSVYNGEKYLREAIDSILSQTYQNFEFIVIDDCSSDNTSYILKSYTDARMQIIRNDRNLKLPASLNKGLKIAKGKYIARMDADDIAMPDRFAKQVEYLEEHSDVAVVGGSFSNSCNVCKSGVIPPLVINATLIAKLSHLSNSSSMAEKTFCPFLLSL